MPFETSCIVDDEGRECAECGQYKPWDQYHRSKHPRNLNGRQSMCADCRNLKRRLGYRKKRPLRDKRGYRRIRKNEILILKVPNDPAGSNRVLVRSAFDEALEMGYWEPGTVVLPYGKRVPRVVVGCEDAWERGWFDTDGPLPDAPQRLEILKKS